MKIHVCCPSYRRPECKVLDYLPSTTIFIDAHDKGAYEKRHPNADYWILPNGIQGNIPRVKNWILDIYPKDAVCFLDDDLTRIGYIEQWKYNYILTEDHFKVFLEKFTLMAEDLETVLWGIAPTSDMQSYREMRPFTPVNFIGGPFQCHVNTDIRYDERFNLKNDYDFYLQVVHKYRKVLRVEKYFYQNQQGLSGTGQPGGLASVRTIAEEEKEFALLQQKWGKDIVRRDTLSSSRNHRTKKKRVWDGNPIIKVPIRSNS